MSSNKINKFERSKIILDESWAVVHEAIKLGYEKEAIKRIKNILGISEVEAIEILDYLKNDTAENNRIEPYGNPTKIETTRGGTKLINCSACSNQISIKAEVCPNCGNPTGVHVCPKCGSTNTKTISSASKATSVFLWGPFAANKVVSKFQCKDCWHKF